MKFKKSKSEFTFKNKAALILAIIMLGEAVFPSITFGLTSGPAQPEYTSFEPVATTSMVNEFSGDFTYNIPVINIPGSNGGGYAMSLSYHSGESVESESSWVGYGWTLNPGAINRGKRGFADDSKNSITYFNDVPANWTVSTGASVGNIEVFSFSLPVSANASIRYNNYKGFGYTAGAGVSFRQGLVSLGYSVSDGTGSFSAQVNPAALLSNGKKDKEKRDKIVKDFEATHDKKAARTAIKELKKNESSNSSRIGSAMNFSSDYGFNQLGDQSFATTVTPYDGLSFNTNFNIQTNPAPFEAGPQFGFFGNYNQQKNVGSINRIGYGYLYSYDAYSDNSGVMDYYIEKESMYNKRDRYMSIPFSNADQFMVSGEGLSGGFRLHSNTTGRFRPNSATSTTGIFQVTGDISLGLEYGGGVGLGLGQQTLKVNGDGWDGGGYGNTATYQFTQYSSTGITEPYFFRFNGDLGGDVDFDTDNNLISANIHPVGTFPGAKYCEPQFNFVNNKNLLSNIDLAEGTVNRSGRSSYIGYHRNQEISTSLTKKAYGYEKSATCVIAPNANPYINNYISIDRSKGEQIGEIATINENGNTYVYGLPVAVGNEKSLQYDLRGIQDNEIESNFLAYKNVDDTYKMKIGQIENGSYYGSYLLTQISTPDYVDRTMDGPSLDDFGGYTKFEYEQLYGLTNPFHYRMPYRGLSYSKGELSDPLDDMGSYTSGDKEIYYMKRIVTKSHIAVFITSPRTDGLEAADDDVSDYSSTSQGDKILKKLDAIELYTNNDGNLGKLVKRVVFKYDYSLCKGVINSNGSTGSNGKLTLKELWFEYDGIVTAKISPYKFEYEYPTSPGITYPTKYSNIQNEYSPFLTSQNPNYSPFAIDCWGNYQDAVSGASRFSVLKTSVNQTPPSNFDPAAWQLKQIHLPSGGQIHVQYEQDDYLFVQDKRAEALVSLSTSGQIAESANPNQYILNVADIGVNTMAEKLELVKLINERYANDKIYFKFLYSLVGNISPDIGKCNSDYITGYVNFSGALVDGSGNVVINVGAGGGYDIPRQICLDLVKKQKGGKLNQNGNCNADESGVQEGLTVKSMVMQLINKIGTSFFSENTSCKEIKFDLSYFKIPCLKAKKGGGIRVKRIMMYDLNGIDNGISALYGTEYFYQNTDGTTSGVATNEPASIRDENALVTFLPKRREQNFFQKAISGIDKEQFEGPIGESLLPAPSVGYSRVVAKNIHSGKTNTGFIVSEFNTVKEFPFTMQYDNGTKSGVENTEIDQEKDWMNLPAIVLNYSISNIWSSQGYRFIINSMHGQPKSVKTYSGDFIAGVLSPYSLSSSTEYQYYNPGEEIPVQKADGVTVVNARPGKEMEVVFEMKQVEDITIDGSIEIDFGVGLAGIIPLPQASLSPLVNYTENKLRTHVTSKVIHYPVIPKSTTTIQDGIKHKTENLVFSAYTGKPLITKTTDGFDGLGLPSDNPHNGVYTSYSIPAYSQYMEMGQKASTERVYLSGAQVASVTYTSNPSKIIFPITGGSSCDALKLFTRGDFIKVNGYYCHVDDIVGNEVMAPLAANFNTVSSNATVTSIEIIRSGKSNQLENLAGGYVTYGQPVVLPASFSPNASQISFISSLNNALDVIDPNPTATFDFNTCLNDNINSGQIKFSLNAGKIEIEILSPMGVTLCKNTNKLPYSSTGEFYIDSSTGQIRYRTSSVACFSYSLLPCIQFCSLNNTPQTISKVVSASAVTYDYYWSYDETKYSPVSPASSYNDYETGKKGKWRIANTYAYNTSVVGGASGTERNYKDAGTFLLEQFNWKNASLNNANKWLKVNAVSMYSPNGEVLEEKDLIEIYSSAKFGYNSMVPYLVVKNSAYAFSAFESFEKIYSSNTKFEDGVSANYSQYNNVPANPTAHSGTGSYSLSGVNDFKFNKFIANSLLVNSGLGVKVWVKDPGRNPLPIKGNLLATSPGTNIPFLFTKVAQTGEWTLYEAKISGLVVNVEYQLQLLCNISSGSIYIDDVRQQPQNAQMNAYVYDSQSLRLVASFDDQHFGLYYQYNQEGKLVRKLIESERGLKTVSETQYHTPKISRP